MKTAFVTSVFGMAGGIAVKVAAMPAARPESDDGAAGDKKGVADVLDRLDTPRLVGANMICTGQR